MKSLLKNLVSLSAPELKLVRYDTAQDYIKTSVCYQGVLRKHPHETDTVLLVSAPFSQPALCYEFKVPDITKVEDLPNIVTEKGENIRMVNLWVRRGSFGLAMQAFEVQPEGKASGARV
ncbi:MAG: hypothetical protein LBT68_06300 [Spirochaetales bacterium]|jgi:hypothetical protein|nr:hypothetical protein [Spirochaetales bacterium]